MWVDILTKPKQGTPFKKDKELLQNVTIDYDDEVERKRTHPVLLPCHDTHNKKNMDNQQAKPVFHHRNVLGIIPNPSNGTPLRLGTSKQSHTNPRKVSIKDTNKSYVDALQDLS